MSSRLPRWVTIVSLLAPAVTVVGVLFLGGLGLGVAQSFGYLPFLRGWHWGLDGYRALWNDRAVTASVGLTLRVAMVSTAVATVLGVAAGLALHSLTRGRRTVTAVFTSTLAVPHLVGALALVLLLSQSRLLSRLAHAAGLAGTPADFPELTVDGFGWGIVAEYVLKETPFVALVVLAALSRGIDELRGVARTLGAGRWRRLRHVVLPLIAPAVAAASVLVFAFSFGSYEVPALLGRPYPAGLPVVALQYQQDIDLDSRPEAMAIAVLIAVIVAVVVAAYLALIRRLSGRPL